MPRMSSQRLVTLNLCPKYRGLRNRVKIRKTFKCTFFAVKSYVVKFKIFSSQIALTMQLINI